jgi:hypothetical protein
MEDALVPAWVLVPVEEATDRLEATDGEGDTARLLGVELLFATCRLTESEMVNGGAAGFVDEETTGFPLRTLPFCRGSSSSLAFCFPSGSILLLSAFPFCGETSDTGVDIPSLPSSVPLSESIYITSGSPDVTDFLAA